MDGVPVTSEAPRRTRGPVVERNIETAEADAKAARLRHYGFTYRQIARELSPAGGPVMSQATAHRMVKRALAEAVREAGEDLLKLELERFDALLGPVLRMVEQEADPMVKLQAVDRVLKISVERRRLLGMDAPTKTESRIVSAIDAELEALAAEVAALQDDDAAIHEDA